MIGLLFTESSRNLWLKEVILQVQVEVALDILLATNFIPKLDMIPPVFYRWPIQVFCRTGKEPAVVNFSSHIERLHFWMD